MGIILEGMVISTSDLKKVHYTHDDVVSNTKTVDNC